MKLILSLQEMNNITERKKQLCLLIVCFFAFFVNNHVVPPDIMESRNIVTAREMVSDGCWLVPTMNGELRLEKPPLPTWFAAAAEIFAPDNIFAQRFMSGCAALLLIFFFWKFARKVLYVDPLIPSLFLCTCYNFIIMARTATWDIYCHAFMMGAIYFLARALIDQRIHWSRFLLAGIFLGLSFMSKGPVSLYALFLPFLMAFAIVFRPCLRQKGLPLLAMTLVAVLIGCWWFVYVKLSLPEQLASVVSKESGSWLNRNVRPWWYYWQFFFESGVWSLFLLTSIFLPFFNRKMRKNHTWLFSLLWMAASLVLLSILPEKKPRYLLPLLLPASYLMGAVLESWKKSFRNKKEANSADIIWFRINSSVLFLIMAAVPVLAYLFAVAKGLMPLWCWMILSIIDVLCAVAMLRSLLRLRPFLMLGSVAILFIGIELLAMPAVARVIGNPGRTGIDATRQIPELLNVPFYHLDSVPLRIEFVYSARRKIRPVNADTLYRAAPCAVLTLKPLEEEIPAEKLKNLRLRHIGVFDENPKPPSSKRHNPELVYNLTLLETE